MKSIIKFPFVILITAFVFSACSSSSESEAGKQVEEEHGGDGIVALSAEQVKLMNIKTGQPERRQLTGYISAPAKIAAIPSKIADIGTLISGRVTHIYVHEGDGVKKGQVLLEIQGLEIGEIKGEFIRTQAALNSAEANFKRQEKLRQENIAAEKAYIEAKSAFAEAKAAFSAADQKLHSIGVSDQAAEELIKLATNGQNHGTKLQTATLKVYSPISGIVSKFNIMLGQLVAPEAEIMEVLDSEQVWAVADIYEKDLKSLNSGQRVEVTAEAWPQVIYSGKLEYISAVVNQETRTVKIRCTLENADAKLKPDMFATMRIFGDSLQASLIVPEAAVQSDDQNEFVFVLAPEAEEAHDDNASHGEAVQYRKVPVQTGVEQDGFIEIKAGLSDTARIVVQGAFFLKSELMKGSIGEHGH